ncbi:hypothetical protein [Streptomyces sp. SP18BB07]|uniref:hypothetical protein n=1 Tax=Streptomyces sp. SP18BB07 TaxID=3002522 RepID=UPI002E77156B|nr:hypothetical protein [Streptomyces sp. SP18BB07]MEE1764378.1 hypothetical protein [Streptomyces sp. SP18BB07]
MRGHTAAWPKETFIDPYAWEQVYIRLQPEAGERLVLAAGFPVFPPPMPRTMVKVRNALLCPACGAERLARDWYLEMTGVLVVGSGCWRHVFVVELPRFLRTEADS